MADYNSKYSGEQVEALLDQVASGNAGSGGGEGTQGPQGEKGEDGVGIESVAQTTTSNADGGSNVITVTLTDGTKSTFTVKNGSKGSQGVQGPKGDTGSNGTNGKDGTDGATFTPSVDSAGNLSWTNNKGLTNPPTVNIKGPKGDSGEGGGSSTGGGKEFVYIGGGVIEELLPNKIYILESNASLGLVFEIQSIAEPEWMDTPAYAEYTVIIAAESSISDAGESPTIILPENVYWANGVIPDMTEQAYYELSIVYFLGINAGGFNAVLTPFKPA